MITKANVLKDAKSAIFEAITTSCCMEEDACGCRYYLHGNEETGDLYECSGEQRPQNVLFSTIYFGELEDDFAHESMDNVDFMNVVEDLADQWMEAYAKKGEKKMTLEMILKSGKIENEEQANIFVENAEFEYAENGWGDYRVEMDNVDAEIYATVKGSGEEEDHAVDRIPQEIRFYRKDEHGCQIEQIENPFK